MSNRFRRIFPSPRPVIAMAHVPALPGSPLYDASAGVQGAIDDVRRDLEILVGEGVPGVYESDMGLFAPDAAGLLRDRRAFGADDLCVLMNVTPEFASPLGS